MKVRFLKPAQSEVDDAVHGTIPSRTVWEYNF